MSNVDAQNQASSTWTTEIGTNSTTDDPGREGGTRTEDGTDGNFSIGVLGADSTGSHQDSTVNGKILAQLIKDAESRLAEAKACIKWYEDVEQREQERLANLLELQKLESQQQQTEVQSQSE